jgi:ATP-dependent helicase/nuclease subunit A
VSASARFLGRFRRARLERFFAHLERRMEDGGGDESMTRFLRQAVAEGGEGSVGAEPDLQADAVHVVTIHGAKGLDFEHVYLLQIHRQSRMAEQKAKPAALPSGDSWEYRIFGWPTPGFRSAAGLQDLQSRAETVRLLYVAMTRAKNRLVVSGGWKDGHVLDDPLQAKSFADLVGHRGEAGSIAAQARDGEERRADEASAAQWVLPALRDRSVDDDGGIRDANIAVPNLNLVRRDAELLAERRRNADQRMKRPFAGAASAGGHDGDDRLDAEESVPFAGESRDRDAAMAAGTILHRLLEELDLEQRLPDQLRAQGERAAAELGNLVGGEVSASARREMEKLVEQIAGGRCLVRLAEVGPRVVAREPAVIAEPDSDGGPVGAVTGFIDLVYRDPEDDRLVVADYKTDRVEGDEELAKRADIYRPQLETYARALRGALALDYEPRCELWFLRADEIVRL